MSSKNIATPTRAESATAPVSNPAAKGKLSITVLLTLSAVAVLVLLVLYISNPTAQSLFLTQGYADQAPVGYRYSNAQIKTSNHYGNRYENFNSFNGNQQQLVKGDRPARTTWHADTGMDVPYKAFSNFTQALAGLNKGFEVVTVEERVAEGVELGDTRTLSTGFWTLLIPAHNFTDYVRDLKKLGRVLRFQTTSVSVEESSINVEMELKLATTNLKRLEAIAAEAKTIDEKLQVNSQIKEAEREVKKYEFANQGHEKSVEYSRVTLEVQELAPPEAPGQLLNARVLICAAFLLAALVGIVIARRVL